MSTDTPLDTQSQGLRLGAEPHIGADCRIRNSTFGYAVEIGTRCLLSNVEFGDYSYIGHDSDASNTTIGKFCSLASNLRINPGNHPLDRVSSHHFTYRASYYGYGEDDPEVFAWRASKPVTIGHDVWLGHGVIVLAGVTIGNGAAIGAGSIVTKDVEPYAVMVGNPARKIRQRFTDEEIADLETLQWWHWSDDAVKAALEDFRHLPVRAFIEKYKC